MLTLFARSFLLYLVVVVLLRAMGKRQIGQMQPYELVLTLMIADWAASPMEGVGTPLLDGILPIAGLVLAHSLLTILLFKSQNFKRALDGKPSILVSNGRIDQSELKRQAITISDLLEKMRIAGYMDVSEVGCAVIESSGDLSVFPVSQKRPPTTEECGMETDYETVPLTLVMDGKVQKHNLATGNLSESWLLSQLETAQVSLRDVLLATVNSHGVLHIQRKQRNAPLLFRKALSKERVNW